MKGARGLLSGKHAVVLALASLLLLKAPAAAEAAFSGTDSASFTASTYAIPAPAGVTSSVICSQGGKLATVTVSSYAKVFRATAYLFTLTAPDGTSSQTTTNASGVILRQASAHETSYVYTLTVQAEVGSWTGAGFVQTYTC